MRVFVLLLFFAAIAAAKSCNLKLLNFDVNKSINLTLQSDKKCKGYSVAIALKNGKSYNFYVNFTPKIVNQAPPFGFSLFDGKEFISLGVDKNIIDSKLDAKLLEDSKIDTLKSGYSTYWHIYLKNLDALKEINAANIEIRHTGIRECRMVYLNYLTQPREKKVTVKRDEFIDFCRKSWSINDKNSLLSELFRFNKSDLNKSSEIFKFMESEAPKKSNKKSCKISIDLVNRNTLYPVDSRGFTFLVEKVNNESFSKVYKKSTFELPKGLYGIRAVERNFSGRSQIINCNGGDLHVTIPVYAHI